MFSLIISRRSISLGFALSLVGFAQMASFAQSGFSPDRVNELFNQAQLDEQAQDYAGAVDRYRQVLKLSPGIAEVWSNLGVDLFRTQREGDAVAAFDHAISLKPSLLAPHLFAGRAYLDMGQQQKGLAALKTANSIAPSDPDVLLALGEAYSQAQQFDLAVRVLQKAIRQSPDSEDASSRLAVTYFDWAKNVGLALRMSRSIYGLLITDQKRVLEHHEAAEAELDDTVAAAPDLMEARLDLIGFLLTRQPDSNWVEKSRKQIDAALEKEPHNPSAMAALVRWQLAQRNVTEALSSIDALAKTDSAFTAANGDSLTEGLSPEVKETVVSRLQASSVNGTPLSGSYSSRIAALEEVRGRRPLSSEESGAYASAAWYLHRYHDAMGELMGRGQLSDVEKYWLFRACSELGNQVLQQTVIAHPDSIRTHLLLADFALQQQRSETARREYEAALALRPGDPEVLLLYVKFLASVGQTNNALEEAKRGAAESPGSAGLSFEAGHLILSSGGDAKAAETYLRQSLAVDPKPTEAHVDLAKAYEQLGQIEDAVKEMNVVIGSDVDGSMHYLLARWYRQLRRNDLAAQALDTCQKLKQANLRKETQASAPRKP